MKWQKKKRSIYGLSYAMKLLKLRVPRLAELSGHSEKTIVTARKGEPITVFIADNLMNTLEHYQNIYGGRHDGERSALQKV